MTTKREEEVNRIAEQWYGTITAFDIQQLKTCPEEDFEKVSHRIEVACYHIEEYNCNCL